MQAARGASLNTSDHTPPVRGRHRTLFAVIAVVGLVIDLATKEWALRALADGPVNVIGDFFTLRLIFNPGAAFSTGTEFTIVFTCLSFVAAVAVLWFSRRLGNGLWAVTLGVLLAGVVGNLVDRVFRQPEPFRGHVVDFLSFGTFPVFNVADMCINVAAGLIILQTFRGIRLDGSRESDHARAESDDENPNLEKDPR